ncbi:neuroblastoma breakpoint family member 4-like [Hippopotamus amphibius kiboko]|uniref:neuroblastoma breakpoint family member 4-like n=1 Tax=Hippopotamus amphibius kiboko TaxID=575201 RepID=UPI00259A3F41|nr:neuroblastoma breakpoint family member 4-like [Hippopotamus amphibius kiboko]
MAVSFGPLSDPRAELTLTEINRELQLQLAKNKQDFRDLTEKFLVSQATAYSLANQLQKYKCEACKDIIESVLGEKLSFEALRLAEKLAEKPTLDERLRTCDILIRSQARELTQLRQTLREGKDDSVLLKQHLKDLVTHNDLDNHQGPGFREQLTEGHRLAERLARKLSPGTILGGLSLIPHQREVAKEAVRQESQDECVSPTRLSGELPQMGENGVPRDSLDEYHLTYDCHRGPVNFQGSEVQTSQAQLQKSTQDTNYLQVRLDQDFDCGDSKASLSLSFTIGGFNTDTDYLDASIGMKTPPKLEGEGSARHHSPPQRPLTHRDKRAVTPAV